MLPEKIGGLPAGAPVRPAETRAFPNVYEVRPTREATPLTNEEQKKLESELTTLREQQKQLANPPPLPPPPPAPPAPKTTAVPAQNPPNKPSKTAAPIKKKQNDAIVPEQKGPVAPPKMVN